MRPALYAVPGCRESLLQTLRGAEVRQLHQLWQLRFQVLWQAPKEHLDGLAHVGWQGRSRLHMEPLRILYAQLHDDWISHDKLDTHKHLKQQLP